MFYECKYPENAYVEILFAGELLSPYGDSNSCSCFNIKFFSRVSNFTLLEFISLQDSVVARSGEPVLVFFRVYNPTGVVLIGLSMYFVYPSNMALFVTKIQCFCFDVLQIKPHESIELPVLFYIDNAVDFETVVRDSTLYASYILFIY